LAEIRQMDQIMRDQPMQQLLDGVSANLTAITSSVTGRFESFDRRSQDFWTDINADSFREITRLITTHHTTLGGVMCGLTAQGSPHFRAVHPRALCRSIAQQRQSCRAI
jgi:hypothetical protein